MKSNLKANIPTEVAYFQEKKMVIFIELPV